MGAACMCKEKLPGTADINRAGMTNHALNFTQLMICNANLIRNRALQH